MTLLKIHQPFCNFLTLSQCGLSCGYRLLYADTSSIVCWNRKLKYCDMGSRRVWFLPYFEHFIVACASGRAASLQGGIVRFMQVPSLCGRIHKLNPEGGSILPLIMKEESTPLYIYKGNTSPIRLKRIRSLKFKLSSYNWNVRTVNYSTSSYFLRYLSRVWGFFKSSWMLALHNTCSLIEWVFFK